MATPRSADFGIDSVLALGAGDDRSCTCLELGRIDPDPEAGRLPVPEHGILVVHAEPVDGASGNGAILNFAIVRLRSRRDGGGAVAVSGINEFRTNP